MQIYQKKYNQIYQKKYNKIARTFFKLFGNKCQKRRAFDEQHEEELELRFLGFYKGIFVRILEAEGPHNCIICQILDSAEWAEVEESTRSVYQFNLDSGNSMEYTINCAINEAIGVLKQFVCQAADNGTITKSTEGFLNDLGRAVVTSRRGQIKKMVYTF